jgi:hypothetical protein
MMSPSLLWENFAAMMRERFLELTRVRLRSDETLLVLPDSFFSGPPHIH